MAAKIDTIPEISNIEISDISGLWEVIRIYQDDEQRESSPWIKDRFKFNFLPEMIFHCVKDGKNLHGTWEIVKKTKETPKRFSIILNSTYEFNILCVCEEEIIMSDRNNKYLLTSMSK